MFFFQYIFLWKVSGNFWLNLVYKNGCNEVSKIKIGVKILINSKKDPIKFILLLGWEKGSCAVLKLLL